MAGCCRSTRRPQFAAREGAQVEIGIEAAQAEAKAVLALRRPVTGPLIAAAARQGGDHIGAEVDRPWLVGMEVGRDRQQAKCAEKRS